jgi:hypothetical protein
MSRPGARFPTLQPSAGTVRMRRNAEVPPRVLPFALVHPTTNSVCAQARAKPLAERFQN